MHEIFITMIFIYIIFEISLGISYCLKFPKRLIQYKLTNLMKRYDVSEDYLVIHGKNNLLMGCILLFILLMYIFTKKDLDPISAFTLILVFYFIQKREKSCLKEKQ